MTSMSRLATALKENAAENYRVYNRTVCALLRGVSNSGHADKEKSAPSGITTGACFNTGSLTALVVCNVAARKCLMLESMAC